MHHEVRPVIMVSKCIEFEACRFNGGSVSSPVVRDLKKYVDFIPVCPEVEIGLPIPREAVKLLIKDNKILLVNSLSGQDYTNLMDKYSIETLAKYSAIDGFILKSRSPSCGINNVKLYNKIGKYSAINTKQVGVFAKHVKERYPESAIEDEGRLTNIHIREHFLTKIFTLARFRALSRNMKSLVKFHAEHKYLFMGYNQSKLKLAGQVVANHSKKEVEQVFLDYQNVLSQILAKKPTISTNINVLLHIFGYFSKKLTATEKVLFLEQLELYREKRIPLIVVTTILKSWVVRFEEKYLENQYYFDAFPSDLMYITDSGKGRIVK